MKKNTKLFQTSIKLNLLKVGKKEKNYYRK